MMLLTHKNRMKTWFDKWKLTTKILQCTLVHAYTKELDINVYANCKQHMLSKLTQHIEQYC